MNAMVKMPDEVADEMREPTYGEKSMADSVSFLVRKLLRGDLKGLAICAINNNDQESCFYINSADGDVLSGPIERLRVMYETNRDFGRRDTTPKTNRSYRSH